MNCTNLIEEYYARYFQDPTNIEHFFKVWLPGKIIQGTNVHVWADQQKQSTISTKHQLSILLHQASHNFSLSFQCLIVSERDQDVRFHLITLNIHIYLLCCRVGKTGEHWEHSLGTFDLLRKGPQNSGRILDNIRNIT